MKVSVATKYGIRGLIYLANNRRKWPINVEEVAARTSVPKSYLLKIFRNLSVGGVVRATRGKDGGFALQRDPAVISLRDIVESIEGPVFLSPCTAGDEHCEHSGYCGAVGYWRLIQRNLMDNLGSVTLQAMAEAERAPVLPAVSVEAVQPAVADRVFNTA
jgi:Rrf2 family protein